MSSTAALIYLLLQNDTKGAPRNYDLGSKQACRTVKNVLPMCEAVHKLWFENAFSVDVEVSTLMFCDNRLFSRY